MFTGIIQKTGKLRRLGRDSSSGGYAAVIDCEPWDGEPYSKGESIAVDGVCLTLVSGSRRGFAADVLEETLSVTALGRLPAGTPVNLERAMRGEDRFGGHIVSGHVDAVGHIVSVSSAGRDAVVRIGISPETASCIVHKGSVAVNGISLTVSKMGANFFEVCIIPATFSNTALRFKKVGDPVNIETDIITKYIKKLSPDSTASRDTRDGLTFEKLSAAGFDVRNNPLRQ